MTPDKTGVNEEVTRGKNLALLLTIGIIVVVFNALVTKRLMAVERQTTIESKMKGIIQILEKTKGLVPFGKSP